MGPRARCDEGRRRPRLVIAQVAAKRREDRDALAGVHVEEIVAKVDGGSPSER